MSEQSDLNSQAFRLLSSCSVCFSQLEKINMKENNNSDRGEMDRWGKVSDLLIYGEASVQAKLEGTYCNSAGLVHT